MNFDKDKKELITKKLPSFGTAGIRGIMGDDVDQININTISAAAYAYATYLLNFSKGAKTKGIVIGHDNRHNSSLFAKVTAQVVQALGVKAFLYQDNLLQPTPFLSYTIRKLKLVGGVMITASHNPKEYNGFKVYNNLGGQLMPSETKKIQDYMKDIDVSDIVRSNKKIPYIKASLEEEYVKEVLNVRVRPKDQKQLKVVFTPQHGTSYKLGPELLSKMDIEYYTVDKQMIIDPNFSHTITPNPEDGRSLNAGIALARKVKADLVVTTDPDADRIGVAVRYKKRYKYLNGNQMAALYLNYRLQQLKKQNSISKNSYIVTTIVSGSLAQKIAKKYGVKIYQTHVGFKNIAEIIEEKKDEHFLFAYEESYGFLIDPKISRDKDSLQGLVAMTEMANYYKTQTSDLYSEMKMLYKTFKMHRSVQQSKVLTEGQSTRLMNRIMKLKEVDGKKVIKREDYRKSRINGLSTTKMIKIYLDNGSWFAIRPSGTEPKVKIYIQAVGKKDDTYMNVCIFEKVISNIITDNSEVNNIKSFSWKTIFKYTIFVSIIVGILAFVFLRVYKEASGSTSMFDSAMILFNSSPARAIWLFWMLPSLLWKTTAAYIRWRMIKKLGGQARMRDLYVANILGGFVSYVTPLTVGGDAIVYWYLRRKGVSRSALLASLMTTTMIYQINTVLETSILLVIGWPVYAELLFNSGDPQSYAATIMFIIGISWSVFAAIMIGSLTLIRSFQEFIVRNAIKLLEWLPFVHIVDPGVTTSGYLYELKGMRDGIRTVWKDKFLYFEVVFWTLLPSLLVFSAIGQVMNGWIKTDLPRGAYIAQIVANDVSRTANAWSFTPGGSGTGEWLSVTIKEYIYNPSAISGNHFTTGKEVASAMDVLNKLINSWPWLIISLGLIVNVIIGESKKHNYDVRIKNLRLSGNSDKAKLMNFNFYRISSAVWLALISGYFAFWMLI